MNVKAKLFLSFLLVFVVFFLYANPGSVFAYAACGEYHQTSFPYYTNKRADPDRGSGWIFDEMTSWPSLDEKRFCSVGTLVPRWPNFPRAGRDTIWECEGSYRTVSCFAHRAPEPAYVPPSEMSTCQNIGGYCGNLHGRVFAYEQTSWPSGSYACASNNFLLGPNTPMDWAPRLMPTDTGSGGRGGYRDRYPDSSAWMRQVVHNPTYDFAKQPSNFPAPGGRVSWRCVRTWGWYTYGQEIYPRRYYIDCWAERRTPDEPECGIYDGKVFTCSPDNQNWGVEENLCTRGYPERVDIFPSPGEEANWYCVRGDGLTEVKCGAEREPRPQCGDRVGEYEYDDAWTGNFCDIGVIVDSDGESITPPEDLGGGESFEWYCSHSGCITDKCEAERFWPPAWMSTRGGLFNVDNSINVRVREVVYGNLQFTYSDEEELSLATELLTASSLIYDGLGSRHFYDIVPYEKALNQQWYEYFLRQASLRGRKGSAWDEVSTPDLSNCVGKEFVYFITGNLDVNPSDYQNLATGNLDGCIFIVSGDINIKSSGSVSVGSSPGYEQVRGYFISDGEIMIEDGDNDNGLKVVGGLFAGTDNIDVQRRFLDPEYNVNYPVLAMFHDARYMIIARDILGETFSGYVRDIGLK